MFRASLYRLCFLGFHFLVLLLIARLAGSSVFGLLSLMMVNAALVHLLTGLGTDQALVWHGASDRLPKDKLFTVTFYLVIGQLVFFFVLALIFYLVTHKTILSYHRSAKYFYWELIYFTGLVLLEKYFSLSYARLKTTAVNRVLALLMLAALILLFMQMHRWIKIPLDPLEFFCCLSLAQGISVVLFFHFTEKVSISAIQKEDFISLFRFSGVVFLTNLIQFLAYRTDYWLIDYFQSADQLGIYAQANRFAGLLWVIPNVLAALIIPAMSTPQKRFDEKDLSSLTRIFNYLNLILIGFLVVLSFLCYTYFLRQDYFEGFIPLLYMLPGFYFFCNTILLAAYFSARNILWVNLAGSLLCFFIIIVADFFLIPVWGIKGAALANSIAYTAASVFMMIWFLRLTKQNAGDLFWLNRSDWLRITKLQA